MYQYDIKPCCILLCIVFCHRICVVICNVFSVFFWPAVCSTWRDEEIQAAIATLHQVFPGEIIPLSRTAWGIAAVALWVCMQRRKYLTRCCSNLTLCQFYSSKNEIINLRVSKRVYIQLSDRRQYIRQQFLLGTIFCQSAARCKKTESSSHTKNVCHITATAQRKQTIDIPASTSGHVAAEIDRDGSAGSVKVGESGGGCLSGRRGQWCHLYPWRPRKSIHPHR